MASKFPLLVEAEAGDTRRNEGHLEKAYNDDKNLLLNMNLEVRAQKHRPWHQRDLTSSLTTILSLAWLTYLSLSVLIFRIIKPTSWASERI